MAFAARAPMPVAADDSLPVNGKLTKIRKGMAFCSVQGMSDDVHLGERSLMDSGVDLAMLK